MSLSPPLLIVFSLVTRSYVLDLQPGNSFVEYLQAAGFDVFVVEWGIADERHADERLEDYADDYLPEAVERTRAAAGTDSVNLFPYCYGGVLALLYVAHHPEAPLRSLTAMATPVDVSNWGLVSELARKGRVDVDSLTDDTGNIPPAAIRQSFHLLKPTGDLRQ